MPIYEYKCQTCGNIDEHFMRVSDPDPEKCSKCGKNVARIISQSSFALKGSGWYVTDYKSSSNTGGATTSAETPAETKKSEKPG